MGTKMAVALANIFMASIEKEILRRSVNKPLTWKRFIDAVFWLWDTNKEEIEHFVEQANSYHPTIKFTAEQLSWTQQSIRERDSRKNYNSCHPAGVKKGFVKGEALRLLRTNCSKAMFEENIKNFRTRLTSRGYPNNLARVARSMGSANQR